jgi:D-glycero-D-manno-heptose 1,7-bisphosphate phosphatase
MKQLEIDQNWTLFLDRDGVINKLLLGDYVKLVSEFEWLPDSKEAVINASNVFGRTIVVTNQRGISKGLMTVQQLSDVHSHLQSELPKNTIDAIYYCPFQDGHPSDCRKPGVGMPLKAKTHFPEIDFEKSIMVGDSLSDIQMGNKLGMITVHVQSGHDYKNVPANYHVSDLADFINSHIL